MTRCKYDEICYFVSELSEISAWKFQTKKGLDMKGEYVLQLYPWTTFQVYGNLYVLQS
jgi:hypothetical protein